MFVAVSRINNPKSPNNGMWVVNVADKLSQPMRCVFMDKSKKVCTEYAKSLDLNPIIGNGVDYGAKF